MMPYLDQLISLMQKVDAASGTQSGPTAQLKYGFLLFKLEMLTYQAAYAHEVREEDVSSLNWPAIVLELKQQRQSGVRNKNCIEILQQRLQAFAGEIFSQPHAAT